MSTYKSLPTEVLASQFSSFLASQDLLDLRLTSKWGYEVGTEALKLQVGTPPKLFKSVIPKSWTESNLKRLRATLEPTHARLVEDETTVKRIDTDVLVYRGRQLCGAVRENNDWYFTRVWLQKTTDYLLELDRASPLKNLGRYCLHCPFCGKCVCVDNVLCSTKMVAYYTRLLPHKIWCAIKLGWVLTDNLCLPHDQEDSSGRVPL